MSTLTRGAARLVADALAAAQRCGASGLVLARMDLAFYNADVVAAIGRAGARFSITARMDPAVKAAISTIDDQAWTPIQYPNAIWDEDEQRLISDAEVAEISYTAFTSRRQADRVTGRLIVRRVRRVRRLNPDSVGAGQAGTTKDLSGRAGQTGRHRMLSSSKHQNNHRSRPTRIKPVGPG